MVVVVEVDESMVVVVVEGIVDVDVD